MTDIPKIANSLRVHRLYDYNGIEFQIQWNSKAQFLFISSTNSSFTFKTGTVFSDKFWFCLEAELKHVNRIMSVIVCGINNSLFLNSNLTVYTNTD